MEGLTASAGKGLKMAKIVFKAGQRVKVIRLDDLSEEKGISLGMVGTIVTDNDNIPCVNLDDWDKGKHGEDRAHEYPFLASQLEAI